MRKYIVKKEQLIEYVNKKQSEKTYYNIITDLHKNSKYLNENVSLKKTNQSVIDNYKNKNLITPLVLEMLIKNNIIDKNYEIL